MNWEQSPSKDGITTQTMPRTAPSDMSRYFRARLEKKISAARTIEIRFFTPEGLIEAFYIAQSLGFIEEVDFIANGNAHRQGREDQWEWRQSISYGDLAVDYKNS